MTEQQQVTRLKKAINEEIKKIPLASYENWGGGGGADCRGRQEIETWFVRFIAKTKMSQKGISQKRKAYWKKVYSLAG